MSAFVLATVAGAGIGAIAFGFGFVFGAIRVMLVVPVLGAFLAVGIELIVFLPILAWVVRWFCRRLRVESLGARFMTGLTAFAVLLSLETGFAILLMKQDLGTYLRGVASPAGLLGLAGQLMLAWLPALTAPRAKATHTNLGLDQGKAHRPC